MTIQAPTTKSGLVPACHGQAFALQKGETLTILNKEGPQAIDFWAFAAADLSECLSLDHTRSFNSKIRLDAADVYVSTKRRKMLLVAEDTSPGVHDTLLCPCNREIYEEMGHVGYHRNCTDNLHEGLAALGLSLPFTPPSLNLFMNVQVEPDGRLTRLPPTVRPGDYLALQAQMDLIIALSACPQDISIINGPDKAPRDIHYRIDS